MKKFVNIAILLGVMCGIGYGVKAEVGIDALLIPFISKNILTMNILVGFAKVGAILWPGATDNKIVQLLEGMVRGFKPGKS